MKSDRHYEVPMSGYFGYCGLFWSMENHNVTCKILASGRDREGMWLKV